MATLPEDRRSIVRAVRSIILNHLPDGFEETVGSSTLSYVVPIERYPDTYNGQPLGVVTVANQKHYVAVYLMGIYADDEQRSRFVDAWNATGKKLDMGKSCLRLKQLDDIAAAVLGQAIAGVTPERLIAAHERVHPRR